MDVAKGLDVEDLTVKRRNTLGLGRHGLVPLEGSVGKKVFELGVPDLEALESFSAAAAGGTIRGNRLPAHVRVLREPFVSSDCREEAKLRDSVGDAQGRSSA